jgi:hypothetical protein
MSTTTTQIQRVFEAMAAAGFSQNQLEQTANLSRGYLSTANKRSADDIGAEVMKKIAPVLHVSFTWLMTGEGKMRDASEPTLPMPTCVAQSSDPYPTRPAAIAALREMGVKEHILIYMEKAHFEGGDPGLKKSDFWLEYAPEVKRLLNLTALRLKADSIPPGPGESPAPPEYSMVHSTKKTA